MARDRLEHQLTACGAAAAPGIAMTYLQAYFDPRVEKFRLRYQGIAAGAKLQRVGEAQHEAPNSPCRGDLELELHPVKDLRQQIVEMMSKYPPEFIVSQTGQITEVKRMREPYHSIYLMWSVQHSLSDMWITSGVFYWNGHLAMRECYEAATDRSRSKSPPRRSATSTCQPGSAIVGGRNSKNLAKVRP